MNNLNIMGFMATMAIGLAVPSADAESFEFHQPIGGLRAAENTANDAMAPNQQTINNYDLSSDGNPGSPLLLGKTTYQKTDVFDMDAILIPLDDADKGFEVEYSLR